MSPYLIHFTSGESNQQAFETLQKIIGERRLLAGSRMTKGQHPCVCFSEAPIGLLDGGLVNERAYSRVPPVWHPFFQIMDICYGRQTCNLRK